MRLEVLISCMNQTDDSLAERSGLVADGLTSDVLMVNQCGSEGEFERLAGRQRIRRIDTRQRGLSNSRNLALERARGDICLLCDDDEVFADGYEGMILRAFEWYPDADLVIFAMENRPSRLGNRAKRLGYLQCFHICSWQIAFRRERIFRSGVRFDPLMGAGTGHGGGEEVKFALDCLKNGLKIWYVPERIASVAQTESTWFHGFDRNFFYQRGVSTRYMLGFWPAFFYAFYYVLFKRKLYKKEISVSTALLATMDGMIHNDIGKKKTEERKEENRN